MMIYSPDNNFDICECGHHNHTLHASVGIGPRIILGPVFANPAEWSDTKSYEPLTVVLHEGNSFTSKQYVPVGTDISDTKYWAPTGNYNEQVEQYRREVKKKPFAFDAVADMQACDDLYIGAICHTNGFHASGDGGAAWYVISSTGTANGMDVLACDGLFANLVIDDSTTVKSFGAHGDGVNNDTGIIQHVINSGLKRVYIPSGTYNVSSLTLPVDVEMHGDKYGTVIKHTSGNALITVTGGYSGNYIHDFTITGGTEGIFALDINRPQCKISNILMPGYSGDGIKVNTNGYATIIDNCKIVSAFGSNRTSPKRNAYGIYIDVNGGYVQINECIISVQLYGVYIKNGSQVSINGCNISECNTAFFPNATQVVAYLIYNANGNSVSVNDSYLENGNCLIECKGTNKNTSFNNCFINLLAQSSIGVILTSGSAFTLKDSTFISQYSQATGISKSVSFLGLNILNSTLQVATKVNTVDDFYTSIDAGTISFNALPVVTRRTEFTSLYDASLSVTLTSGGFYHNKGLAYNQTLNINIPAMGNGTYVYYYNYAGSTIITASGQTYNLSGSDNFCLLMSLNGTWVRLI